MYSQVLNYRDFLDASDRTQPAYSVAKDLALPVIDFEIPILVQTFEILYY